MRRRESAPLQQLFNKRKPSDDELYRESLVRFKKFREHERIQRLSLGANDMAAYHSISDDQTNLSAGNTTPTDQQHVAFMPNTCPTKSYRAQTKIDTKVAVQQNGRTKKISSVQFRLNESTTDECDSNFDYQKSRHSMPAFVQSERRAQIDAQTIEEEEREEFEAHCMNGDSLTVDDPPIYRSPPMKFYKENSYPSRSEISSLSTRCDAPPVRGKCPVKPKRSMPINNQSLKKLSEAHFTGAYKNYVIQSPYYTDTSSLASSMTKQNQPRDDSRDYNDENSSSLAHYQVIVNKHGDEVEYALPCVDLAAEYQRRTTNLMSKDAIDCERVLNENFEMTSNASSSMRERIQSNFQRNGRVMITDLDKSTDSINTFEDLDNLMRDGHLDDVTHNIDLYTRTPNRVLQFHETMQCADIICKIAEFESVGKMDSILQTPLHFEWGNFKGTDVTVRKYADLPSDNADKDFTLIAETAIIRDAEVLR